MGRKIVVTSGKGGVGKTTVTSGLGMVQWTIRSRISTENIKRA